jgi:L-lactate dehydrogenase
LENGVVQRVLPSLNNLETDRLTQSIQTIKRNYLEI